MAALGVALAVFHTLPHHVWLPRLRSALRADNGILVTLPFLSVMRNDWLLLTVLTSGALSKVFFSIIMN